MLRIRATCFVLDLGRALCGLLVVLPLLHCGGREHVPTTLLAGPGAMALAGPAQDRVFVANRGTDSVQVLALKQDVDQSDFIKSAARYFPLHLKVGTEPTELVSAGNGQYVFVLDAIDNSVSVIDAVSLTVLQDNKGARQSVALGDPQAQARGIAAHKASTCAATHALDKGGCVARAYVTQHALGVVSVVDVRQSDDGALSLVVDDAIVVGGAPEAIATSESNALFVTDDSAPDIVRVRLSADGSTAPTLDRFAVGAIAGSVAATTNAVAVTRPSLGDVVVFGVVGDGAADVSQGLLSMRDGDATLAPVPRCLAACSDPVTTCASAHPADRALCIDDDGYALSTDAAPYLGMPTVGVPRTIAALPATSLANGFVVSCAQGKDQRVFASGFAVASFNGAVEFIGIDAGGNPQMVDAGFCESPALKDIPNAAGTIGELLAQCPAHPARHRFGCAQAGDGASALIMRGEAKERIGLQWEGILPGGEGEAVVDADGSVTSKDESIDFASIPLLRAQQASDAARGDVFEVLTLPNTERAACQQALLASTATVAAAGTREGLCGFERRITAIDARGADGVSRLRFDRPLPAACFPGTIRYRLRAGDTFLVGRFNALQQFQGSGIARVAPGASYGQPIAGTVPLPVAFHVRGDLDIGDADACQRYHADGRPKGDKTPWRSRAKPSGFEVTDPAHTLQMAATFDASGRAFGRVGFLPHALLFTPATAPGGTRLLVSYAGSNALYMTPAHSSRDVVGETPQGRGRLFTN